MNINNSLLTPLAHATHEKIEKYPKSALASIIVLSGAAAGMGAMHSVAFAIAAFAITFIASLALVGLVLKANNDDVNAQTARLIAPITPDYAGDQNLRIASALRKLTHSERKLIVDQVLSVVGRTDNSYFTSQIFDHLNIFQPAKREVNVEQINRIKKYLSMGEVLNKDEIDVITQILPFFHSYQADWLVGQLIELRGHVPQSQRSGGDVKTFFENLIHQEW